MKNVFFSLLIVFLLAFSMLGNINFVKAEIEGVTLSTPTYEPEKMILGIQELEQIRVTTIITNNRVDPIRLNIRAEQPTNAQGNPLGVDAILNTNYPNAVSTPVTFTITRLGNTVAGTYNGRIIATEVNPDESPVDVNEDGQPDNVEMISYSISVEDLNPKISTDLENGEILITSEEDNVVTKGFNVQNSGNIDLDNLKLTLIEGTFSDGSEAIRLRMKIGEGNFQDLILNQEINLNTPLAPLNSLLITIEANIMDGIDLDTYTGKIKIEDTVRTQASLEVPIIIKVEPEICKDGRVSNEQPVSGPNSGNLRLKIDNPDKGDDFKIGDEISIEVEVENKENKDMDFVVEAILYDLDRSKRIESVESDSIEIEKDSKEDFDLIIEVPNDEDIDPDNTYILYVKAYEDGDEDKYCNYDSLEIDLEREDDDVIINTFTVNPLITFQGDTVSFSVLVENIGTDKQEDVTVKIRNIELGLDLTSNKFDLKEYDKSGNDKIETFTFTIPEDAEAKDYIIEVLVYDKRERQYDNGYKVEKLTVQSKPTPEISEVEQPTVTQPTIPTTGAGTYQPTRASIFDNLSSTKTLFIIGDIVLVILAVLFLILIFKRK